MERNMFCEISFVSFYKKVRGRFDTFKANNSLIVRYEFKPAYARIHFSRLLFSKYIREKMIL